MNNRLYLKRLEGGYRFEGEPIFAEWFTGTLRLVDGECVHYVHLGFQSRYAVEKFITIEAGRVVNRSLEHHTPEDFQ